MEEHYLSHEVIQLPQVDIRGGMSLNEALYNRGSKRNFKNVVPSIEQLALVLWAGQGKTHHQRHRTAPSAGGLFPMTIIAVSPLGIHGYDGKKHTLSRLLKGDYRPQLEKAALDQSAISSAPIVLVVTADVSHSAQKYGKRAERYCLMEAGHIAQNILLECTAIGLAGVPIGAFNDAAVEEVLRLPSSQRPIYLIPIGSPVSKSED